MSAPFLNTFARLGAQIQKMAKALTWTTDTGQLYIAELNGTQYPISGLERYEFTFTETDGVDSSYTATVTVPAGYTVYDILWGNTVVWNAATSAALIIGDGDDPDGYYGSTNLKTTPTADTTGAWGINLEIANRPYRAGKYYAAGGTVTAVVTTDDDGTHHAGRSRMAVLMAPGAKTVTAATKAAA